MESGEAFPSWGPLYRNGAHMRTHEIGTVDSTEQCTISNYLSNQIAPPPAAENG